MCGPCQQPSNFFTQHRRGLAGIAQADELTGQIRQRERLGVKKSAAPQWCRSSHSRLRLMNPEPAEAVYPAGQDAAKLATMRTPAGGV